MNFILECDELDGLVFTDKSYLTKLNSDILYSIDILLDLDGKSELVFDFPDEEWDTVRQRETKPIRAFCDSGKMIIWLLDSINKDCTINKSNEIANSHNLLHLPTGNLLAITASELIQCLSYPELEMKKVFELEIEDGWYAIWNGGIDKIMYCKNEKPNFIPSNIEKIFMMTSFK